MSAEAQWYRCPIDKKQLKQLMRRSDGPAIQHFSIYFAVLIALAAALVMAWGTLWAVPAVIVYSMVWAFANANVHETCHGTPFRTRWLNEAVLFISGWMVQMEPVAVRWTHSGHHTYTSFERDDSELALSNPISWGEFFTQLSGLGSIQHYYLELLQLAFGRTNAHNAEAIPRDQLPRCAWNARIYLMGYAGVIAWAVLAASWLPVFLLLLPRFVGGPMYGLLRVTQHTGLAMNVQDHRRTTRSFYTNRVLQFFYLNMNYHVEHHMFPMVPFYNLPALHAAVKDQLPAPNDGLIEAYGEILGTVRRQQHEPGFFVDKIGDVAMARAA